MSSVKQYLILGAHTLFGCCHDGKGVGRKDHEGSWEFVAQ